MCYISGFCLKIKILLMEHECVCTFVKVRFRLNFSFAMDLTTAESFIILGETHHPKVMVQK